MNSEEIWIIKLYSPQYKEEWDSFIDKARNSVFLFRRDYMDYHSHIFSDYSLMAYRRGKLAAVLPANKNHDTLLSHQGLTYGGWVWESAGPDTSDIFLLWKQWLNFCKESGIAKIIYKPLPYIYAIRPSQEDLYCLFLSGANLIEINISNTIDLSSNPGYNKLQRRHLKNGIDKFIIETFDATQIGKLREFHELLKECLIERHNTLPVHNLEELSLLSQRFSEEIKIWGIKERGSDILLGAVCVYITRKCVHCQYIATSKEGRALNVLPVLIHHMIESYQKAGKRYFDFGISNEDGGWKLNRGLNRQKTSMGATGVAYQRYEINVSFALKSLPSELWPQR